MNTNEIEQYLRTEETHILQHAIKNNLFVEEVRIIAEKILLERNQVIPLVEVDEQPIDYLYSDSSKEIIIYFFLIVYLVILYFSNFNITGIFILTIALFLFILYLLNRKDK